MIASSADGSLWLSGGVGMMNINAREYVWDGGHKESQLDWESHGVTIYSATLGADLPYDFKFKTTVDLGFGGNGHMTDYDWVAPLYADDTKDGWSDRSLHPDTDLKHYVSVTAEIGKDLFTRDNATLGIDGGFKYSDVKWDAKGGSYIYSSSAPRDTIGSFDAGEQVINYRQKIPSIYLGVDGSTTFERLTLTGGIKGGLTFGIQDIDNHLERTLRFNDDMQAAPMMMVDVGVDYRLTGMVSLYASGTFEQVFKARGDTSIRDTSTGATGYNPDTAGASFQTASIKFGLRGRF